MKKLVCKAQHQVKQYNQYERIANVWEVLDTFVPHERIVFYYKPGNTFCGIQYLQDGKVKNLESWGEDCADALAKNLLKFLSGDQNEKA